ncbi:hypothetical protein LHV13_00710 [Ferrovum sp. PN-J185]|uniref:hypothetical protein n=1 Tax=Ferrovum sp. PN-J185 TaxID=1356306 RepID=UPI001E4647DC|nr:hypothetical protein [Ferrovum sp. PN-J185]MCC6067703.1 hypothetical protein [Ferrovum sp. PN-J185]
MYTITTMSYTLVNILSKLFNILFNPNIDDCFLDNKNSTQTTPLITGSISDLQVKMALQDLCIENNLKKNWVILVVKENQQNKVNDFLKQFKLTKHLVVTIKSNEAKKWAIQQALQSNNCIAVVVFDKKYDNYFYTETASSYNKPLFVLDDHTIDNQDNCLMKAA